MGADAGRTEAEMVVQTVLGPVPVSEIGFTLPHEHVYAKLWLIPGRYDYAGQIDNEDILVEELGEFTVRGGSCLVDLTLPGIGRDPLRVADVARRTGLHIVAGTGFYREPYYPPEARIDRRTVESIADEMVWEIEVGIGKTGIRAGIIGEIGTEKSWVSAQEERVCRAAGRAQARTGAAITTHSVLGRVGLDQLDLFVAEGADPRRVIIGHCDWIADLDYCQTVIDRGASVAFDAFGHPDPYTRGLENMVCEFILELLRRGHASQLLLSQDVCGVVNLKRFGGAGYSYVQERVIPQLLEGGATEDHIRTMTVENPRRLLAGPPRPPIGARPAGRATL
ncbi:MAG: hypothetical protein KKA32_09435 [Actinobacteria bacterium]|nr:hypothetical protein [Actinomycetota bacterium]